MLQGSFLAVQNALTMQNIYVAATSQHVGKTTCTLGLVKTLQKQGINVGYCKPVGQEFVDLGDLRVDKDALLFAKIIGFDLKAEHHSPVIIGRGATSAYLNDPSKFNYSQDIEDAAAALNEQHDMVVYEGTGHPGVGSVVDLNNADVAKKLNAKVMMVVEGGVGNTIDRLHMSTALFREKGVEIAGVVVNKTLPEKIDKVRRYVGGWLKRQGLPLLGVLPYDRTLLFPIMATVRRAIAGRVLYNESNLDNQVEDIVAGSLVGTHDFSNEKNLLLVVSQQRFPSAIAQVMHQMNEKELDECPLAGVIITGDGRHAGHSFEDFPQEKFIRDHKVPVVTTPLDTFGSVVKISKIEVKINTRTPWKAYRAISLFREHVDLNMLTVQR